MFRVFKIFNGIFGIIFFLGVCFYLLMSKLMARLSLTDINLWSRGAIAIVCAVIFLGIWGWLANRPLIPRRNRSKKMSIGHLL